MSVHPPMTLVHRHEHPDGDGNRHDHLHAHDGDARHGSHDHGRTLPAARWLARAARRNGEAE